MFDFLKILMLSVPYCLFVALGMNDFYYNVITLYNIIL